VIKRPSDRPLWKRMIGDILDAGWIEIRAAPIARAQVIYRHGATEAGWRVNYDMPDPRLTPYLRDIHLTAELSEEDAEGGDQVIWAGRDKGLGIKARLNGLGLPGRMVYGIDIDVRADDKRGCWVLETDGNQPSSEIWKSYEAIANCLLSVRIPTPEVGEGLALSKDQQLATLRAVDPRLARSRFYFEQAYDYDDKGYDWEEWSVIAKDENERPLLVAWSRDVFEGEGPWPSYTEGGLALSEGGGQRGEILLRYEPIGLPGRTQSEWLVKEAEGAEPVAHLHAGGGYWRHWWTIDRSGRPLVKASEGPLALAMLGRLVFPLGLPAVVALLVWLGLALKDVGAVWEVVILGIVAFIAAVAGLFWAMFALFERVRIDLYSDCEGASRGGTKIGALYCDGGGIPRRLELTDNTESLDRRLALSLVWLINSRYWYSDLV
jgi:hypothetical protein